MNSILVTKENPSVSYLNKVSSETTLFVCDLSRASFNLSCLSQGLCLLWRNPHSGLHKLLDQVGNPPVPGLRVTKNGLCCSARVLLSSLGPAACPTSRQLTTGKAALHTELRGSQRGLYYLVQSRHCHNLICYSFY